jgi:hypothetical protein
MVEGHPDVEGMEEPDLCGRVYLGVRSGKNGEETEKWVKDFRGMIGGRLEYGR